VTGACHIESFRYLPDGTNVPKMDSSNGCESNHTRTIGTNGTLRETWRVSLCAEGGVNLKQESPGRDVFYET
jgi:hypothetical protein